MLFAPLLPLFSPVTMMDWRNGNATAKYWVLKLVSETVAVGESEFRPTTSSADATLFAQGILGTRSNAQTKVVLLINKRNSPVTVTVPGATSATIVDSKTHQSPPRTEAITATTPLVLAAYATAFVTVAAA